MPSKNITVTKQEQNVEEHTNKMEVLCIPSVRRLAKQYKLDLSKVKGTGKGGRILKEDVLRFMEQSTETVSPPSLKTDKTESLSPFQRAMVKTMTESLVKMLNFNIEF